MNVAFNFKPPKNSESRKFLIPLQVKQLIEMSTVIRSRSGWFEREGAVFECRRQGTDVQLRSSSSSSNPLVWDIE
ncbi:hypothetical protein J6590_066670 [Homalodisca vitripennis]|nr:hypothetical protein J6590_066670 [Homalodisca vitripennis]